jgi:hypothetical protein
MGCCGGDISISVLRRGILKILGRLMKHIIAQVVLQFSAILFGNCIARIYKVSPNLAWETGIIGMIAVLCMGIVVAGNLKPTRY